MLGLHYSTSGAWGTGIGTLTPAQFDENFWLSIQGLASFDLAVNGSAITITDISEVSGELDEFTVSLSNGHVDGPFALTYKVWIWQGKWLPGMVYEIGDVFWFGGTIYQVVFDHTSASTFSPGANDGKANDFYKLIVAFQDDVLPIGGGVGAALTKLTHNSFDTTWTNDAIHGLPIHGAEGQWLTRITSPNDETIWETNAKPNTPSVEQADAQLVLSTSDLFYNCANTRPIVVQIAPDPNNALPVGSEWHFFQGGTPQIEFEALFPHITSLTGINGFRNRTALSGAVVTLKKVATETYHLFGYLAPL